MCRLRRRRDPAAPRLVQSLAVGTKERADQLHALGFGQRLECQFLPLPAADGVEGWARSGRGDHPAIRGEIERQPLETSFQSVENKHQPPCSRYLSDPFRQLVQDLLSVDGDFPRAAEERSIQLQKNAPHDRGVIRSLVCVQQREVVGMALAVMGEPIRQKRGFTDARFAGNHERRSTGVELLEQSLADDVTDTMLLRDGLMLAASAVDRVGRRIRGEEIVDDAPEIAANGTAKDFGGRVSISRLGWQHAVSPRRSDPLLQRHKGFALRGSGTAEIEERVRGSGRIGKAVQHFFFGDGAMRVSEEADEEGSAAVEFAEAEARDLAALELCIGDAPTQVDLMPGHVARLAQLAQAWEDVLDQMLALTLHVAKRRRDEDADLAVGEHRRPSCSCAEEIGSIAEKVHPLVVRYVRYARARRGIRSTADLPIDLRGRQ